MAFKKSKDKILILGASGFLGGALYKELHRYYNTIGTYHTGKIYSDNKQFIRFDLVKHDIFNLLQKTQPQVIIYALRGPFKEQIVATKAIVAYAKYTQARVVFLSSANVFDAFSHYPSYEFDKTLSESIYGKLKMRCEHSIMSTLPEHQYAICRLPMVFGVGAPRVQELKNYVRAKVAIDVFPHLIINTITAHKLTQQIHYIINRKLSTIFHLGSSDLIHHKEFIHDLIVQLKLPETPIFKNVYTSNFDRYLAVLPKDNKLPKHLLTNNEAVIQGCFKN